MVATTISIIHRHPRKPNPDEEFRKAAPTKDCCSAHLANDTPTRTSLRRRPRRKPKTAGKWFHVHLALLSATFHSALLSIRMRLEYLLSCPRRRRNLSSAALYSLATVYCGLMGHRWYSSRALHLMLDPRSGFHPAWHPRLRSKRFPSVEERVKLYMSNWYLPPCQASDEIDERVRFDYQQDGPNKSTVRVKVSHNSGAFDSYSLNTDIRPDTPLVLRQDMVNTCALSDRWFDLYQWLGFSITSHLVDHDGMRPYCENAGEMLSLARDLPSPQERQLRIEPVVEASDVPVIAQFGDEPTSHLQHVKVPYFKKYRSAITALELTRVTMPPAETQTDGPDSLSCAPERPRMFSKGDSPIYCPIVWLLKKTRHFGGLNEIPALDTPWEKKQNKAVWRGTLTGTRAISADDSDHANCMKMIRCRIPYLYQGSKTVDAGISHKWPSFPDIVNGIPIVKGFRSVSDQLRFKAVIILEGNDVATGLKWSLLSKSVVLMPPPTVTSWAMEELLEPWVHFIPLDELGSNIEERLQWIAENDEKARKIAERATLFMYDLTFHPNAQADDLEIKREIMRRYRNFFVHV